MSRNLRIGLILLGVLSLVDLAGPLLTDGDNPPMSVAIAASVLGAASLVCAVLAWRGNRGALITLVVLRLISAVSAAPAFFVTGVPTVAVVAAAAIVALTLVGVVLVLGAARERTAGYAR
jgi:CHASE2 domain-containing sensor protein